MNFKNNQGVALLNLIVTLSIITILAVISIPNIRQFQNNVLLTDSARALTVDLRYAQQLSVTNQITHGVVLDPSLGAYWVIKYDGATSTIKIINLPAEISFSDINGFSGNYIRFNSYGSVAESGYIELAHSNGNIKTINIRPSGYVQLQN